MTDIYFPREQLTDLVAEVLETFANDQQFDAIRELSEKRVRAISDNKEFTEEKLFNQIVNDVIDHVVSVTNLGYAENDIYDKVNVDYNEALKSAIERRREYEKRITDIHKWDQRLMRREQVINTKIDKFDEIFVEQKDTSKITSAQVCPECGDVFETSARTPTKTYCSAQCQRRYNNRRYYQRGEKR